MRRVSLSKNNYMMCSYVRSDNGTGGFVGHASKRIAVQKRENLFYNIITILIRFITIVLSNS